MAVAEEDVLGAVDDGLETAAAEAVDGERGNVHWHTAAQTDVARAEGNVGRNTIKQTLTHKMSGITCKGCPRWFEIRFLQKRCPQ